MGVGVGRKVPRDQLISLSSPPELGSASSSGSSRHGGLFGEVWLSIHGSSGLRWTPCVRASQCVFELSPRDRVCEEIIDERGLLVIPMEWGKRAMSIPAPMLLLPPFDVPNVVSPRSL